MENGEGQPMAGNGPFPYTVFFADEGENNDDYGIISGEIVKRGTIVVITNDFDSDDTVNVVQSLSLIESIVELMNTINSTNNLIPSSFGNIDLNHWGVSGHGVGSLRLLTLYFRSGLNQNYRPTYNLLGHCSGLVLISRDGQKVTGGVTSNRKKLSIDPATPATGLFMTGTVDEIARGQDNLPVISATEQLGWHWMHVLG